MTHQCSSKSILKFYNCHHLLPREELKQSAREFCFLQLIFLLLQELKPAPARGIATYIYILLTLINSNNISTKCVCHRSIFPFFFFSCHSLLITENHVGKLDLRDHLCRETSCTAMLRDPSAAGPAAKPSPHRTSAPRLCDGRGGRGAPSSLSVTKPSFTPAVVLWMTARAKCHLGINASVS